MLKRITNFMDILMGGFIGAFIGGAIYQYLDYKKYADLYATYSAPWYTSIQVNGMILFAVLIICILIKFIIYKRANG